MTAAGPGRRGPHARDEEGELQAVQRSLEAIGNRPAGAGRLEGKWFKPRWGVIDTRARVISTAEEVIISGAEV